MTFTVGIAGITGKFALSVTEHLLKQQNISIRGYCRNTAKLPSVFANSSRITVIEGQPYDDDKLRQFARGCNVVLCGYLGDDELMTKGQTMLIDACATEHVSRYIASDYSLDYTRLGYGELFVKDPMRRVYEYAQKTQGVEGVHLLIGVFMETFWSDYLHLFNQNSKMLTYWGTGDEKWEATTYGNAAEYAAAIALDEKAVGLQHIVGDRKSVNEIAQLFEAAYGEKLILENQGTLDQLYERMHKLRKENPADWLAYVPLFYQYYCTNGSTYMKSDPDNKNYPSIKPITFEEFLTTHKIDKLADSMQNVSSHL